MADKAKADCKTSDEYEVWDTDRVELLNMAVRMFEARCERTSPVALDQSESDALDAAMDYLAREFKLGKSPRESVLVKTATSKNEVYRSPKASGGGSPEGANANPTS